MTELVIMALVDNTNGADEIVEILRRETASLKPALRVDVARANSRTLRYEFWVRGTEPALQEFNTVVNSDVVPLWREHALFQNSATHWVRS